MDEQDAQDPFDPVYRYQQQHDIPGMPIRLRRASHTYNRAADALLRERTGLSLARFIVLATLEAAPGLTGKRLAELTWQRPQSLAEVATALEADGLIERRAGHGRERLHFLSDAGVALLLPARKAVRELNDHAAASLGAERIAAFEESLVLLQRALQEMDEDRRGSPSA